MIIFDLDGTLANCEHRRHFVDPTCKECKARLDSSIEFDLGWHCDYPCDNVTRKEDWKPDWKSFFEACDEDKPIDQVIEILSELLIVDRDVVIWSGRCESVREKTTQWIKKNITDYFLDQEYNESVVLKMRPIGDNTPDDQLKERWLDEYLNLPNMDVLPGNINKIDYVFDSNPKSISMWRRRDIFVFDCNQTGGE